jgi:TonB dependent receptor/CarboxypepD_reg-like domain/TonB-dependent Receptor Plug Domain
MKQLIITLLVCMGALSVVAQSQLAGKISDKANGEGLLGAAVVVENTTNGAITDMDGNYNLPLAPGAYTIAISFVSYQTVKVPVTIKANETTYLNQVLEEVKNVIEAVTIVAKVERSTAVATMIERKKAAQLSDGVSADQIRKTPDRTTSDVLKRVTGASIQDNKFAIIRGMNDRYNAGYLDGALLPSTESDRKAFAFDVVPANLIDNLSIIKSGSPDLVGDFGGGIIKINTKAVPEEKTQSLTIGTQLHSLTTFKPFTQFKTYAGENLNFVSSQRAIPTELLVGSKDKLASLSQQFNNDWSSTTANATPNTRLAYSLGLPIRLPDNQKLGVLFALNYANTRKTATNTLNTYDGSGQVAALQDNNFQQNISSGGLFNVSYMAGKTQVNFRNLLNINTDNSTIQRTGTGNISDALTVRSTTNMIQYNRLYNSILSAKQILDNGFTVTGALNFSSIRRRMPDYRIVSYTKTPDFDNYMLPAGDFFKSSSGRFTSDLTENIFGGNVEAAKSLILDKTKIDFKAGYAYQYRNRHFAARSFVYNGVNGELTYNPAVDLGSSHIGAAKLYLVEKTSKALDNYDGKSILHAGYLMADQKYGEKWRAVYGLRYETMDLNVSNPATVQNIAAINKGVLLPSVNATYYLTEKVNLRAAYYKSVNRPEFRELAPFAFFVFDKNAEIRGNKDLQIAQLNHFDARAEYFLTGNQIISVGGFYKTIQNPIEMSIDVTQPFTTFTFRNEKSATIYGVELEMRKNLGFLPNDFFKNIAVFSNLSLMKSVLNFEAGTQAQLNRPLQGQSPYIINAGLQYDNSENGWSGSLVMNQVGRRIAYVGVDAKYGATRQDIYENPRSVVDFQIGKNFKKFNLKLTMGDLLHQDLVFYQDANLNGKYDAGTDRLMFKYNHGFTGALSFTYNF